MRKLIFVVAFFAIALGLTVVSTADEPSCDGTSEVSAPCNNKQVPTGYYESFECEGDLPELGSCKNAIAFNVANFKCSEPALSGSPPSYRTYCVDSSTVEVCTISKICLGETIVVETGSFTRCAKKGDPTVTTRLLKSRLYDDLPSPKGCIHTVAFP